jgi:hypothetical protein
VATGAPVCGRAARAKEAAGEKDVLARCVGTAQLALDAGVLHEMKGTLSLLHIE